MDTLQYCTGTSIISSYRIWYTYVVAVSRIAVYHTVVIYNLLTGPVVAMFRDHDNIPVSLQKMLLLLSLLLLPFLQWLLLLLLFFFRPLCCCSSVPIMEWRVIA